MATGNREAGDHQIAHAGKEHEKTPKGVVSSRFASMPRFGGVVQKGFPRWGLGRMGAGAGRRPGETKKAPPGSGVASWWGW